MAKRELEDWQRVEAAGFRAIERRKEAGAAIIQAARMMVAAQPGSVRLALWEPLELAVKEYEQAHGELVDATVRLGGVP